MTPETRVAIRTAADVDTGDMKAAAELYMSHRGGAFPKDMTPQQAGLMARLSLAYGLDPLADELLLYQNRPYVTIQGRTRKAQEHPAYDGLECLPATEDERKAFRAQEDEHLWVARVWRKDRRFPFIGYGRAGGRADKNPVSSTWGQEMAQKRAKSRALRDAFAMPLPDFEDQQGDYPPVTIASPRYQGVGPGPVIEGEYVEGEFADVDEATGELPETGAEITGSQVTKIHTLVSVLKWDDEEYRGLLKDTFDVESSLDLTEGQAAALSECLEAVLAEAQEQGTRVEIEDVAAALRRERYAGALGELRTAQRTMAGDSVLANKVAERRARQESHETQTMERRSRTHQPPGISEEVLQKLEDDARPVVIEHEPGEVPLPLGETVPKSRQRIQAEANYGQLMAAAARLESIDLAAYEIDADTTDAELTAILGKLAAEIRVTTEAKAPATA